MTEANPYRGASPVVALAFGPQAVSSNLVGRTCVLMGWAAVETTGAAVAAFDLLDGADDGGSLIRPVALAAGASTADTFSSWGIVVQRGLRLRSVAGSVRGAVYVVLL